jgi:endonuclease/exonuclease/phosphatase family metal-dependent hydrolase
LSFQDREFGDLEAKAKKFSRDLLGVELYATSAYRFLFFVAHLKSKLGGDKAAEKRALEAKEIRSILEGPVFGGESFIHQPMILAGDMNDDPDAEVIDILRGKGKMALKDILEDLDDNYTYPTHKKYPKTRLDYIFASKSIQIERCAIHRDEPAAEASDHYPVSATIKTPN